MKIRTLVENTALSDKLCAEHGLSLYIETENRRILFDAGQTDAFARNAERLGVDLAKIDLAVLSHGHYDHSGGLRYFLDRNDHAPVYVTPRVFGAYFNAAEKSIGIDPALRESDRLIFAADIHPMGDGLTLYSCNDRARPFPADPCGLTEEREGKRQPDRFLHEQYLLAEENGRRVLFSGCSHKGILNIVHWFQPDVLVGGFHFMKLSMEGRDAEILRDAAEQLLSCPAQYYTGHCTGAEQFAYLKQIMGDRLHAISGGSEIVI